MRWAVLIALACGAGCSGKGDLTKPDEQQKPVRLEDHMTLDGFLNQIAAKGPAEEAKALDEARRNISKLSKLDQEHEQKALAYVQKAPLGDFKKLVMELSNLGVDPKKSPITPYLVRRLATYYAKLPDFRELTRWGWENTLTEGERTFENASRWEESYIAAFEHHQSLPELVKALKSKKEPSEDAKHLFRSVFSTNRLPYGWN